MKYSVTVVEQITESRTYEVEADTAELAARQAAQRWVVDGEEGENAYVGVDQRTYEVNCDNHTEEFGVEVEGEADATV